MVLPVIISQKLQNPIYVSISAGLLVECKRKHHIFEDREGGNEIELLENIAKDLSPNLGQLAL